MSLLHTLNQAYSCTTVIQLDDTTRLVGSEITSDTDTHWKQHMKDDSGEWKVYFGYYLLKDFLKHHPNCAPVEEALVFGLV